ncbi:hypothetical protein HDV05_007689 [Chytridiales sp. JEL 0842]|nr:hypothetical protein HDV05_007689 [Chytridiales sp. JEL 0842]
MQSPPTDNGNTTSEYELSLEREMDINDSYDISQSLDYNECRCLLEELQLDDEVPPLHHELVDLKDAINPPPLLPIQTAHYTTCGGEDTVVYRKLDRNHRQLPSPAMSTFDLEELMDKLEFAECHPLGPIVDTSVKLSGHHLHSIDKTATNSTGVELSRNAGGSLIRSHTLDVSHPSTASAFPLSTENDDYCYLPTTPPPFTYLSEFDHYPESPATSGGHTRTNSLLSDTADFPNPLGLSLEAEPDFLESPNLFEYDYNHDHDHDSMLEDESAEDSYYECDYAKERLLAEMKNSRLNKRSCSSPPPIDLPQIPAPELDHPEKDLYSLISTVTRHPKTHLYYCPYPSCHIPGMTRWYNLKMHWNIHFGEATKQFWCIYCEKRFRRKFDMQRHVECLHHQSSSGGCKNEKTEVERETVSTSRYPKRFKRRK